MKSIEERATAYACAKCECGTCPLKCDQSSLKTMDGTCDLYNKYRRLYIEIATEQKTIDDEEYRKDMRYIGVKQEGLIEKACKTYCRFCPHQCENYPHDDCQIQIELKNALEE